MHKLISILSILFLGFITWIIYLANTGQNIIFFEFEGSIPYGEINRSYHGWHIKLFYRND